MKCENCGKWKKEHIESTVGSGKQSKKVLWCYPLDKVEPRDEEYFMQFKYKDSQTNYKPYSS